MAKTNPFLASPFQALIDKQAEPIQLPGSDLVTDVEVPDLSAAPEQPAAQVAQPVSPAPKKAKAKPVSLIPPADLMPVFSASASHFGVPENVLMAIAQQESSYDPDAVNAESGASGIVQYMDATAKSLGINRHDPNEAIPAAAMQIAERLAKGASLEDAVMEHFAGPDRKKWGNKTRAYGKSVLEKAEAIGRELYKDLPTSEPEPAVTADAAPLPNFGVAPEALKRIQAQWNAATPEERVQMEAIRGPRGYIAKELNKRHPAKQPAPNPLGLEVDPMAQVQEAYKNPTLDSMDPRAEARARNLVNQGMEGNTANKVARAAALADMAPGTEPGIGQRIENSDFDFATRKKYQEDPFFSNPAVRGAVKGYEGYKRGILGLNQMAAEVLGADNLAGSLSEAGAESRANEAAMGEAGSYGQRMFEGAVSSIAQQVPALVGGAVTGSEALVLGTMFAQTFGSEYSEGRARGQNEEQAVGRAALYGTFEVVGEKLGLGDTLKGLRGAVDGATTKDVVTSMARALLKEIPGEQLTTLGQFGTDKLGGGYGLNTEAGLAEYLQQAADTAVQTVMQGGIMGGVTTGAAEVGNRLAPQRAQPQAMPQERVEPSLQPEAQSMQPPAPSMQPEQVDETWSGEVMGDDGLMRRVSNEGVSDPVATSGPLEASIVAVAEQAPEPGPLSSAVTQAAQLHDADPAPMPAMPEPEPQAPDYTAMPVEELKAQLKTLGEQGLQVTDPEQRKKIRAERKTVEKEIGARKKQAQADSKPAEEPMSMGPFDDIKTANKMMMRYAEKTSVPHEVIEKDGKFRIQLLEASDGNQRLDHAGNGRSDGLAGGGGTAAVVGDGDGIRPEGTGPESVERSGNDGKRVHDLRADSPAADVASNADEAVAKNPYAAYSASKPEFAESYMDKRGVDRSKYEVQQTGPVRWQIVPRAAQDPIATTQMEEVADVSERQEVRQEAQAPSGAQSTVEASAGDRTESVDAAAGTSAAQAKPKRKVNESVARRQAANAKQEEAVAKATASLAARAAKKAEQTVEPQQAAVEQPPAPIQQEAKTKRKPAAKKKTEPVEEAEDVRYSVSRDSPMQRELYKDRDTILTGDARLDADMDEAETGLTDEEYEARSNDWQASVQVPLSQADAAKVIDKVNGMLWFHGSAITDLDALELRSDGGLFMASDDLAAGHYAGKSGRVYERRINVKNPFFVRTSDLTADMESSGEIDKLAEQGFDAIIPLDYGDIVILKDGVVIEDGASYSADDTDYSLLDLPMLADSLPVLDSFVEALASAGIIKLHANASTLPVKGKVPQGVQALTTADGKIHVVANALNHNAKGIVMHESFHAGVKGLVGTKVWNDLVQRLNSLYRQGQTTSGAANEFWKAARQRVKVAQLKGAVAEGMEAEEFGAYAIEEYANAPLTVKKWVDDLIGAIKAWALRRFGAQLGQITPAQLSALAKVALLDVRAARMEAAYSVSSSLPSGAAPTQANAQDQARTLTPPEQGLLRRVQAQIQDGMNRVKQVQERITELTGVTDFGGADVYRAENNRPGRIAARKEDGRDKLFKPLMERLAKSGYTPKQLETLLHAQHAVERNEKVAGINPEFSDGGSGMRNKRAGEVLAEFPEQDHAELYEMANHARTIAREILRLKLSYGLISQDDFDALGDSYEFYVPLKGDGEYGFRIKRAMGHEEREEHILENIARDYEQAIVAGEKNLARQSLLQLILQHPDDELWTARIPPKGRRVVHQGHKWVVTHNGMTLGEFDSEVEANRQSELWATLGGDHFMNYEVQRESAGEKVKDFVLPLQDHEILVYVKGDAVRLQIFDEKLAGQLRPLKSEQMNAVLELMRKHNRYLSMIFTGYNPAFIIKNASRDAITGTLNMTGNHGAATAVKAWAKYPMAWATMLKWAATKKVPDTEMGRMLTEYRAQGGKVGASYMSDLEEQGKSLQRMYDDAKGVKGYAAEGKVGKAAWIAARKAVGGAAHAVEVLNQAFENALRLALFAQLRAEGKKPGVAAAAAKSVTVNFDRKGAMTAQMGAFFLFINPAIQGTANATITLTKGEHKYQAWALLGMMAAAGFGMAAMGMDEDKDRWLGEKWDTRTKNLRLRVGETTINIPMSQEFAPFYAIGVAMGEVSRGESSMKAATNVMSSFLDAYYPMQGAVQPDSDNPSLDLLLAHIPTVAKAPAQIATNRNSFGSKVVPETENTKNRPDNLKMSRSTKGSVYDKAAQALATGKPYENDLSKVSPETIKLLWSTYTGGLGRFVADTVGAGNLARQADVDMDVSDVPIVKDFVKPDNVNPIRSRFYDLSDEARKTVDEFNAAKKALDGDAMREITSDPVKKAHIGLAKMVKSINEVQTIYAEQAVAINADKKLNDADKRARLKQLEAEQEAIYRKAIEAFKQ